MLKAKYRKFKKGKEIHVVEYDQFVTFKVFEGL